jgi:leucyl-tRNA synthetase
LPIDYYCGGDHAVSHLLYSRFWMHFFADQGWIEKTRQEPVGKLVYNGYILAHDGNKMSKSKGNVVNPDDLIEQGYGADSLRLFEMFIAPYEQDTNWNTNGVPGTFRFLQRFWTISQDFLNAKNDGAENNAVLQIAHKAIKQVSGDLDRLSFNTAVASLMEAVNALYKIKASTNFEGGESWHFALAAITQLLAPFAPHISEELWHDFSRSGSVHSAAWPVHNEAYLTSNSMKIVVQVNGKVRATLELASDSTKDQIIEAAKQDEKVASYLEGNQIKKEIYVPNKLVSFVV